MDTNARLPLWHDADARAHATGPCDAWALRDTLRRWQFEGAALSGEALDALADGGEPLDHHTERGMHAREN